MTVSAVVITKNEEHMIANCLDTLSWCKEVIVVDNGSTDRTVELAKRQGATVVKMPDASLPELRNEGKKHATGEWILYVDADERVTPKSMKEMMRMIRDTDHNAYEIPRNNIQYGVWMQHGGWEQDNVVRLFRVSTLKKWEGDVHEHAEFEGEVGKLHEALVHLTHRNMVDGLKKSIEWTGIEAQLLFESNHPKMSFLRFMKIVHTEFIKRIVFKKGWKDGMPGIIEAMVQAMNRFIVYERLWELQQKPSLEEKYKKIEEGIAKLWKES